MNLSPGILIIFGVAVFGGILSAFVVKRLSIPQVLGYIIVGLIIGESGLQVVTRDDITFLAPFNYFALGIIGFLVGSEILFSTLKEYSRQFAAILIGEGILTFLLVGSAVTLVMYSVTESISISLATGIVFGAIASATDPASTINVLWEYRSAGVLSTTIIAIVALDDALAMTLYGLGTGIAELLSGSESHIVSQLLRLSIDLFGSVILGIAGGLLLNMIMRKSSRPEQVLAAAIGLLLLCIGLAVHFNMDVILVTMSIGITVVNRAPRRSRELIHLFKSLSTPIYVLFFVLVGARLGIQSMPGWMWLIVVFYVAGRSAGKIVGAWVGARVSKAEPVVRRYTGLSLFAQGGVAIGLSIMASQHLTNIVVADNMPLGDVIIFGVTATTFIVQILGPPLVKLSAKMAGEIGKDISEEDIIRSWTVKDVMQKDFLSVSPNASLREVFSSFSASDLPFIPVINNEGALEGTVSLDQLKESISDQSCWDWLVASDIMEFPEEFLAADEPLEHAMNTMNQIQMDQLPVLETLPAGRIVGIMDRKKALKKIQREMLSRRMGGFENISDSVPAEDVPL
jgi:Kef-type K+ transport system membrane component KefB/predicted transcriptional regulator